MCVYRLSTLPRVRLCWWITALICLSQFVLSQTTAQDDHGSPLAVSPTPVLFPPPPSGRPELICPYFPDVQSGYRWQGITVGVSTRDDLESALKKFGRYEVIFPYEGALANAIGYLWSESEDRGISQQAPFRVDVCFQDGRIVVMDITWFFQPSIYIEDLIALLGEPDIVTWSLVENTRVVFWFERGIAAEIFVQHGDPASFGKLTRIIYFPPQSSEGYEKRWPFSVTRKQPFYPVDPSIPSEQNPFDFDAMIATITAQPSRTPTPTLTPRPTQTATATPTSP